jgi:oxygen-independent coproporphyrinogen-3 oxidase
MIDVAAVPLAVYVHWPWCVRKCPYCDFNSHGLTGELPEESYVAALLRDLAASAPQFSGREIVSVFLGGGTPSLFPARAFERVLDALGRAFRFAPDIEITIEANPGTAEAARFREYRAVGINRLSLGVQSLRDARLLALGRIHNSREARAAYALAREAGFTNVNVDLMYGLPHDDVSGALEDLGAVVALGPEQISWYQLTLEPGTQFHRAPPPLPDEETVETMDAQGRALLAQAGYARYEISAYARPGYSCRHNRNYWEFGDYLGLGAGAHGKRSIPEGIERQIRIRDPRRYLDAAGGVAVTQRETITEPRRLLFEFLLNALRLVEGVERDWIESRTGIGAERWERELAPIIAPGWVALDARRLAPTPIGLQFQNEVLTRLLPAG